MILRDCNQQISNDLYAASEGEEIYVRKAELAQLLSVSPRSIDNWIAKRMIQA